MLTSQLVSVTDIQQVVQDNYVVAIKYVRLNNEYRFAFAGEYSTPDHNQMVNEGEEVQSAAYFKLYRDRLELEGHSSTLGKCSLPDDEAMLANLFGVKVSN